MTATAGPAAGQPAPAGPTGVPAGFRPVDVGGPFVAANGPLFGAWRDDQLVLAMRVEARHCNPAAQCHGGMLATFADMLLPYTAMYDLGIARRFTPTVSLQTDFVAPVGRGSWLEGLGTVVRSTRTLLFVQGLLFVGAEVVARASGIYKWGDPVAPAGDDPRDPFGLRPAPR